MESTVSVHTRGGKIVNVPRSEAPSFKARHADSEYTRALAIRGLDYETHRKLIRESARKEGGSYAGLAALNRLDPERDRDILVQVAQEIYWNPSARNRAVGKLIYEKDRELLREIAVNDNDFGPRSIAVQKLDLKRDRDIILDRLQNDGRWQVRLAALEKLDPQADRRIISKIGHDETDSLKDWAKRILDKNPPAALLRGTAVL